MQYNRFAANGKPSLNSVSHSRGQAHPVSRLPLFRDKQDAGATENIALLPLCHRGRLHHTSRVATSFLLGAASSEEDK